MRYTLFFPLAIIMLVPIVKRFKNKVYKVIVECFVY